MQFYTVFSLDYGALQTLAVYAYLSWEQETYFIALRTD